jgi:hypothetical protein
MFESPGRARAYTGLARGRAPEGLHAHAGNDAPRNSTLGPRYLGRVRLGSQPSRKLEAAARWRTRIEPAR